jgi:hypothetical protein
MSEKPSCDTCDFMRYENQGAVKRCYWDPPSTLFIGMNPPRIQGGQPSPIVSGARPEVISNWFCRNHPLLRPEGVITRSPGPGDKPPPPAEPIIIGVPASETRQ